MQNKKIEITINEIVTYTEYNKFIEAEQTLNNEEKIYKQMVEVTPEELKSIVKEISQVLNK